MVLDPGLMSLTCLQNEQLRKDLELSQNGQTMLIDKLIACCKEVRMTPVNHPNPRLPLSNVFSHTSPFTFRVAFTCKRSAERGADTTTVRVVTRRTREERNKVCN